jgi:hypothetical protein
MRCDAGNPFRFIVGPVVKQAPDAATPGPQPTSGAQYAAASATTPVSVTLKDGAGMRAEAGRAEESGSGIDAMGETGAGCVTASGSALSKGLVDIPGTCVCTLFLA